MKSLILLETPRRHHHWLSEFNHIDHRKGPNVCSTVGKLGDTAVEQVVAAAAPAPTPAAAPARAPASEATTPSEPTILAPPTTHAAAGSLARLAGSLRIADTNGQTVEGVVRELLKPMLKDWLDKNLPAIVESRVEAELERIARLAR